MNSDLNEAIELYKRKLTTALHPLILHGLKSIYNVARQNCKKRQKMNEIFKEFQLLLKAIPEWSETIVKKASDRILTREPLFQNLMTAIFVGEAQKLRNIKITQKNREIKIDIPTTTRFIHSIYINTAHKIFYHPTLFDTDKTPIEREENVNQIYDYITQSVHESIYDMLPIKNILRDNIGHFFDDDDDDDHDERERHINIPNNNKVESEEDEESILSNVDSSDNESIVSYKKPKQSSFEFSKSPPPPLPSPPPTAASPPPSSSFNQSREIFKRESEAEEVKTKEEELNQEEEESIISSSENEEVESSSENEEEEEVNKKPKLPQSLLNKYNFKFNQLKRPNPQIIQS